MPSTSTGLWPPLELNVAQLGAQSGSSTRLQVLTRTDSTGSLLDQGQLRSLPEYLTIRFQGSPTFPCSNVNQHPQIATAILSRIRHLVPSATTGDYEYQATGVIFNQWIGLGQPSIDIVCPTAEVCEAICKELKEIDVKEANGHLSSHFSQESCGDTLPLDVLPFDVLGPQVMSDDLEAFIKVLEKAMAPLGTLTGSLSIMFTMCEGQVLKDKVQRVVRGYVRLSKSSLQLDLDELVEREPMLLPWVCSPPVMFAHRHLECYKKWASRNARRTGHAEGAQAATSSRGGDEAKGTSKKRKTGGQ